MSTVSHMRRVVGRMDGQTFVRSVDPARHQLRTPPAWSHDNSLLLQLRASGCQSVRLESRDGGSAWMAPLTVIFERGFPVHRQGYPPQTALALGDWATLEVRPATAEDVSAFLEGLGVAS